METDLSKNKTSSPQTVDLAKRSEKQQSWSDKSKKLSRNVRYSLINSETENLIKELAQKYKLVSSEKIGGVSVLIRNFVVGELNEEGLKKEILQR
ncbi:MAG: hypothetical protein KAQ63_03645, partial [Candidatus Moranbacteria bacterium]|nr:hypothetical protein [Candidatus Moranbacteria bacterium]